MSPPHVLIIGGGIGGLVLAQGLAKRGIMFTLFERDATPTSRAQGYRIRIAGAGANGLEECLNKELWDLFEDTCAETKPFGAFLNAIDGSTTPPLFPMGPAGKKVGMVPPGSGGQKAYTVDRTLFRSLLLLGQESHIQFGKDYTHYKITPSGITAFFSDGSSAEGTFLVGVDGRSSRVRKQLLPQLRYVDSDSRIVYGKTPLTSELFARFPSEGLKGMSAIRDGNLLLFLEPIRFPKDAAIESNGRLQPVEDYVYWVFGGNAEHFGLSDEEFHSLSGKQAAELTLKTTGHWKAGFRSMFELQNVAQSAPLRLISAKPSRPEWPPSAHVTLLGDSIHAMLPTGGSGANCAIADAALLARLICEEGISKEMSGNFIDLMWEYALPSIEGSAQGAQKLWGFKGFEGAKEVGF
ncbi:hypothetical protein G7Y89_g723 [Cudoniella acicularis]|uniref:FAD-binding domain-containing protein n=1 Tax=Cudoniella acicularis TaxID=354080 RepID=A0A8H4RZG4_9HELO|nr:hypothetical protein G7Y89_g723 [Cudoniella acicularis]